MPGFSELIERLSSDGGLAFLAAVMVFYLLLESVFPVRLPSRPPLPRWATNVSLFLVNGVLTYFLLYNFFGVDLDAAAANVNIGLFQLLTPSPFWVMLLTLAVVSDFTFYWFHRAMHTWRPLWRAHVVHHSDLDVDLTVSFRGHPFQLFMEAGIRMILVILLGIPLSVLIVFDLMYTMFVFYPHAKVNIPRPIERILRTVIVTSDMHRVHHSSKPSETNSNYGDIFSFWDRMFGTYQFKEIDEQAKMTLGLEYFRNPKDGTLWGVLKQPFTYKPLSRESQQFTETDSTP